MVRGCEEGEWAAHMGVGTYEDSHARTRSRYE